MSRSFFTVILPLGLTLDAAIIWAIYKIFV